MSSRVYPRGQTSPAERIHWPDVGPVPGAGDLAGDAGQAGDPRQHLAQLQRETERRVQESRQAGYQEGLAAARAEGAAELQALAGRVAQALAEMAEMRPRLRRQAEADLVKLALAIARRILHRELVVDPEALRGLAQAALERLQSQEIYRVRIHPAQEALFRSALQPHPQARAVEFLPDPSLAPGAAIFETAHGNLDASVDTQLREIEQGLADRLRRHG